MHGLSEFLGAWAPPEQKHRSTFGELVATLLLRAKDAGRALLGQSLARQRTSHRAVGIRPRSGQRPAVGRVAFVGAGPGDPELLTLKALRALQAADVVLHDQLVSEEVLALIPPATERIGVGKKGYGPSCKQDAINDLMVVLALSGRHVVRLKAGDPLMFGRLEEEIAALEAAGVDFVVVPGISAAQGAAASLKVPLTRRRGQRRYQAITGHAASGRLPDDFDWAGVADPNATTAVYMPKATIGDLCAELLKRGLSSHHPATAVFNTTRANEMLLSATIATLPERIAAAECDGPCIILIGVTAAQHTSKLQPSRSVRVGVA